MPIQRIGFDRAHTVTDCPDTLASFGPTLAVNVGFDPDFDAKAQGIAPKLGNDLYNALIDTGASHSSIDADLGKKLNLPIVDRKPVSGVHGAQMVEICTAQIYLPVFNYTIHGQFALVLMQQGGQPHHALLGRALLRAFTLYYDGVSGYARLSR